jgi:hypothetical protein
MAHESAQLAVALGIASQKVDFVFEDKPWIVDGEVPGSVLRCSALLSDDAPPIAQILWKDGPVNAVCVVEQTGIQGAVALFKKLSRGISIDAFNLIVLCEYDGQLFQHGTGLAAHLPWKVELIQKVVRGLALKDGSHKFAFQLCSSAKCREVGCEPIFKMIRLLSPGVEPKKLFLEVPPPPSELWAVCLPKPCVTELLEKAGVGEDHAVVLPGVMGPNQKWVVLRDVSHVKFKELEEHFYEVPGVAFCSYKTFRGDMDDCAVVVQGFWRKSVRTNENLAVLWKVVDWQLKMSMDQFTEPPRVQWVAANKVRVGLRTEEDFRMFMVHSLPILKSKQIILKNERTGEFLDEDEALSVGGSSMASGVSSLSLGGSPVECVVISDLPSYFLTHDVDDIVRKALRVKGVVGCEVVGLCCKRLEWAMGNPMSPSWQVCGAGVSALEGSMLQLGGGMEMATVVAWKEYATARAAFRARAQQRRQDSSGWGGGNPPRPALQYVGPGKGSGKGGTAMDVDASAPSPPMRSASSANSSTWMQVDWTLVKGKRARNEQSQ